MMTTLIRYAREDAGAHPANAHAAYASTQKRAPLHALIRLDQTLSEITGPHFGREHVSTADADLSRWNGGEAVGERIVVTGRVLDEDARPIPETLVEIWQANAAGRYAHDVDQHDAPLDPHFCGFGRVGTDAQGCFRFRTIKPGPVPGAGTLLQAPHINVSVFARGLLKRLVTRIYFPDEPLNAQDPVLNALSDTTRRATLIACPAEGASQLDLHFDVVLQGDNETVFFDI